MKNSKFKIQNSLIALGLALTSAMVFAQTDDYPYMELQLANYERELSHKNGGFVENRGQLGVFGQPGVVASEVLYYSNQPDFYDYVLRDRLSFVTAHSADTLGFIYNVNRLDLWFYDDKTELYRGLNPVPYLVGHAKRHFYTGLTSTGIENVNEFGELFFETLYTGVDMSLSHNRVGLRALFRCAPKVNPNTIKIELDGLTALNFSGGNVNISSYQSTYQFHKPVAYQIDNSNNVTFLTANYNVDANGRIFFDVPNYDTQYAVFISVKQGNDPILAKDAGDNLEWSSYIGETGKTTMFDVTNDEEGNVIYAGTTNNINFLGSVGNGISSYAGGFDAFMFKLNEDIEPQWYTFFGGDIAVSLPDQKPIGPDEYATGITTDGQSLFITGGSSSANVPMVDLLGTGWSGDQTNPQVSFTDCETCEDIFYAKFDANGVLQYSTYFGADGSDLEVAYDILYRNGNINIVGIKNNNTLTFNKAGAYNNNSNDNDGLILEFDSNNDLTWSTGFNVERVTSAASNESGDLIVGGNTNYTLTIPAVNQPSAFNFTTQPNASGKNGFIAVFNANSALTHTSYYNGSCGDDVITGLSTDPFTNVTYGVGFTVGFDEISCLGSTDLPIIGNGLSNVTGQREDHFYFNFSIPQTNSPLNYINAGYFGGNADELFDYSADILLKYSKPSIVAIPSIGFAITGATRSSTTSPVSFPNTPVTIPFPAQAPLNWYLEPDKDAGSWSQYDAYVSVFDENAVLKYSTYFGHGRNSEGGAALSYTNVNGVNRLFFAGNTNTLNTLTTPNVERLFTEEYNTAIGSLDYYIPNFTGSSYSSWGSFLTLDGINTYLSLNENDLHTDVMIYPNPSSESLTIQSKEQIKSIELFSVEGKLIQQINDLSTTEYFFDLMGLSSGSYVVRIISENGMITKQIQKK